LRTDLILTDAAGRASIHSVQLNRTGGQFRIRITAVKEQARAGAVSTQFIGENRNGAPANAARAGPAAPPRTPVQATPQTMPQTTPQTMPQTAPKSGEITETTPAQRTAKSGEITPTTTSMGSGSHRKWIVLAAIVAAGAGAAFAGVSRANSGSKSTVSSSVVSMGTPTVTIGNP
jgi:hypothetical protein